MIYFNSFLNALLRGEFNFAEAGADVRAVLIAEAVDVPVVTNQYLSDIAAGARLGTVALTGQTVGVLVGTFDAADVVFANVGTGTEVGNGVLLYDHNGGSDGARRLIAYFQSGDLPGLPTGLLNNSNVSIVWNANGIIRLVG